MPKTNETPAAKSEATVDDFSESAFSSMGYTVTPNTAAIWTRFKNLKDRLQPGRLSPEGHAFVAVLADLVDGKLKIVDSKGDAKSAE